MYNTKLCQFIQAIPYRLVCTDGLQISFFTFHQHDQNVHICFGYRQVIQKASCDDLISHCFFSCKSYFLFNDCYLHYLKFDPRKGFEPLTIALPIKLSGSLRIYELCGKFSTVTAFTPNIAASSAFVWAREISLKNSPAFSGAGES